MTQFDKQFKVVIPARGGSKGIKRKNIQFLNDLPLIAYPIIAGINTDRVSNVYVSTDDKEIMEISKSFGAEIIPRPPYLAEDNSIDIDVMRHAVNYLKDFGNIVHLRSTTPMVTPEIIENAIKYFLKDNDCTSLRSCHECSETAYKFFKKQGKYLEGLFNNELEGEYYNLPRQKLPKTYQPNGCIDIIKPSWFMHHDSLHGEKMLSFETKYMYEVDTPNDLRILRMIHDQDRK